MIKYLELQTLMHDIADKCKIIQAYYNKKHSACIDLNATLDYNFSNVISPYFRISLRINNNLVGSYMSVTEFEDSDKDDYDSKIAFYAAMSTYDRGTTKTIYNKHLMLIETIRRRINKLVLDDIVNAEICIFLLNNR